MASIKWIKITTDMFENRKIKYLRKLPNGNSIVLIWIMLLTMAGKCNSGGMVYLTEDIPYSVKMLADEMDVKENIVQSALEALEKCNMISRCNDYISISGWDEYQNTDGMSKVREQNRKRVAKYREKQKESDTERYCNAPCNVTVTQSNATEIEKEEELDKELDTAIAVTPNPCCCNAPDDRPSFDTVEIYVTNNLLPLSPRNMEELADFKTDLPEELIRHAIDESCAAGVRKWNYAQKIMETYRENGYKTIGEVLAAKDARKSKPGGKPQQNMNYQQHSYTDSDFDSVFYNPAEDYKR